MKKILIIINPKAGKKEGSRNLADIIDVFCRKGYRVAVETTAARGDGTEIAKREAGNPAKSANQCRFRQAAIHSILLLPE